MALSRAAGLILSGLPYGAVCMSVGLLVVAAGHGWDVPAGYSAWTLALGPLALLRLFVVTAATRWTTGWVLALAALAPLAVSAVVLPAWNVSVFTPRLPAVPALLQASPLPIGWLLLPVVLALAAAAWWWRERPFAPIFADIALIGFGLACNLDIRAEALSDASFGFRDEPLEWVWFGLWSLWQLVALLALGRHLRHWLDGSETA